MKLYVCLSLSLMLFLSMPTLAQSDTKYEAGAGYSLLRENAWENRHGFVLSFTQKLNKRFGIETEVGGNYNKDIFPFSPNGSRQNDFVHSILAGPQFKFRQDARIQPWAHVLAGITLNNESRPIFVATQPGGPVNTVVPMPVTNVRFGFQPGGGIDFWMTPKIGIRLGVDYRRAMGNFNDRDFFRAQSGIVFRFGHQ